MKPVALCPALGLILGIPTALALSLTLGIPTALAQTNPGAFQPIARVDPNQPLQLSITNNSGATLEYGLTTRTSVGREIQPGETLSRDLDSLPAYINISTPSRPPYTELSLAFRVRSTQNRIEVTVTLKSDTQGDRIIDINPQGGIYVY